ncbi:MAG: UDP-N-acetyl glucosamine 2-epimerase, partial [DPANN group archaeon]|nr:UDP-N-acetyl glucosamine 2-epimerase [DPANN group archaeon]
MTDTSKPNNPSEPSKPITVDRNLLDAAVQQARKGSKKVVMFVPATKPCFYKMWSLVQEAERQGLPHIILDSAQHYDALVGHGMVEFGLREKTAINLNLRGDLSQKSAELFTKMKDVALLLKKAYPDMTFTPYVNGDTLTAGILPAAWMFATNTLSIQGEAGLRGMTPSSFRDLKKWAKQGIDVAAFVKEQWDGPWTLMREEPFPEQWDTYVSAAGCHTHFAPVDLNRQHLVREGYAEDSIHIVGNTVVDALALKKKEKAEQSIFDDYPSLEEGSWLRVDIHRRGNLQPGRFKAIIEGVEQLVKKGHRICMVELTGTHRAIDHYGYRKRLQQLAETKDNFLITPLWKEYGQVIEFLTSRHCQAILTDSGSMQEEANELGVPCLTARFNT